MKLKFSQQIFRKVLKSIFMNIRPVEAELFHADKQTDRRTDGHDKANSHFFKNIFPTRALNFIMSKTDEFTLVKCILLHVANHQHVAVVLTIIIRLS